MSKICDFCGKGYQKNNLVPRGIGNRVTKRTIKRRSANLRSKRMVIDGTSVKTTICTSCLKRIKYESRLLDANNSEKSEKVASKTALNTASKTNSKTTSKTASKTVSKTA